MKYTIPIRLTMSLAVCWLAACYHANVLAQVEINWVGADGAAYNVDSNWDFEGFGGVPGIVPGDIAVIGNATQLTGVANLNSNPLSPAGLILGNVADSSGTLNMTGGSLTVEVQSGTAGRIWVGAGGTGTLNLSGGSLNSVVFSSNAASTMNLTGGSLNVSQIMELNGTTIITGNSASLNVGILDLNASSSYAPTITAAGITKANATGLTALEGTLDVTFAGGVTPSIGETWDLIEASTIVGDFAAVNTTVDGTLPDWHRFRVAKVDAGGGREIAQLQAYEALRLQVNPNNGNMTILSGTSTGVAINGYRIQSSADRLDFDGATWTTLSPTNGWNVANASSAQLAELKSSSGGLNVTESASVSLGTPYMVDAETLPFGEVPGEDITFTYNTPSGETFDGIVELVGGDFFNNFVLTIDPDDGQAELRNDSNYTIAFDSYQLTSASSVLDAANWDPLGGAWQIANQNQVDAGSQLAELNTTGNRVLGPGQRLLLGTIFPQIGSVDPTTDLALVAANSDPGAEIPVVNAVIRVGDVEPLINVQGDFNGDGIVDLADYTVWRNNLGASSESVINDAGNGNNMVDSGDYTVWKNNFGTVAGAVSAVVGTQTAVPEPQSLLLCVGLVAGVAMMRSRNHRQRVEVDG
ncbi:hypothetical protein NG895_07155 [Aeoliella sp. ICT_H6.2]|uniref:PEP-CTERM protein-sorting domain-containing protein n=1 Tax=Aeoliella straminimaris TaxID=2954799 RepID=A0A9X2F7J6_9BACT|nr:hypothetical protein [Aeoliella straminimaris]MCO6043680.1 hypothetical protein [Aeoliella straminimaris]